MSTINQYYKEIKEMVLPTKIRKIAIASLVLLTFSSISATLLADGKALYAANGCEGCHGADGTGSLGPRLAGQQEKYIIAQFKLIRDGERASGLASVMSPAVKSVSDDDAAKIAAYLASLK